MTRTMAKDPAVQKYIDDLAVEVRNDLDVGAEIIAAAHEGRAIRMPSAEITSYNTTNTTGARIDVDGEQYTVHEFGAVGLGDVDRVLELQEQMAELQEAMQDTPDEPTPEQSRAQMGAFRSVLRMQVELLQLVSDMPEAVARKLTSEQAADVVGLFFQGPPANRQERRAERSKARKSA